MEKKAKINKWSHTKLKIFWTAKKIITSVKRQTMELEKIANHISNNRLIQKPMRNALNLVAKKDSNNNLIKNWQRIWRGISPKNTCKWPTPTWKAAQHDQSSGKCKSKGPWGITSHLPGWLLPKSQKRTSVGEDVEKRAGILVCGWWGCKLV